MSIEKYKPWHEELQLLMEEYLEVWESTENTEKRREQFDKLKTFITVHTTSLQSELLKAVEELEKKESPYILNMRIKQNPPSETTRTNLFRNGYNACLGDIKATITSVFNKV